MATRGVVVIVVVVLGHVAAARILVVVRVELVGVVVVVVVPAAAHLEERKASHAKLRHGAPCGLEWQGVGNGRERRDEGTGRDHKQRHAHQRQQGKEGERRGHGGVQLLRSRRGEKDDKEFCFKPDSKKGYSSYCRPSELGRSKNSRF